MTKNGLSIEERARMFVGVYPHDEPSNYLIADNYFDLSCRKGFGEAAWSAAVKKAKEEKERSRRGS
jgi:hypothetical protein